MLPPAGRYRVPAQGPHAQRPKVPRAPHATRPYNGAPYDPLAPVKPPTLAQIMAQLGPLFGPIASDAQIAGRARGLINPQVTAAINAIEQSIGRHQRADAATIAQGTQGYADAIKNIPGQVGQDYQQAAAQRANANAAFAQFLASQGGGADLASKLGAINAPGAAQAMAAGASTGAADYNALASAASGTADLNKIITSGGAAKGFADTLPGLVALKGEQNLGDVMRQYASSEADQVGSLRAKVPEMITSLVQQLTQTRDSKKQQKIATAINYLNSLRQGELSKATVAYGYAGKQYTADASAATADANRTSREKIAAANRKSAQYIARLQAHTRQSIAQATQGFQLTKQQSTRTANALNTATRQAAQMKAGTYGQGGSSGGSLLPSQGGKKFTYTQAYKAIYNYLNAQLAQFLPDKRVRFLVVRTLRAAGYTSKGQPAGTNIAG